jgi:hypothetical protein
MCAQRDLMTMKGDRYMEKRYKALRTLSTVYKVLAWIALVVGVLVGLGILTLSIIGVRPLTVYGSRFARGLYFPFGILQGGIVAGIVGFLVALLASAFYFLVLYAVSELVFVLLSIEENTRETAYYLRGEGSLSDSTDTGVPLNG